MDLRLDESTNVQKHVGLVDITLLHAECTFRDFYTHLELTGLIHVIYHNDNSWSTFALAPVATLYLQLYMYCVTIIHLLFFINFIIIVSRLRISLDFYNKNRKKKKIEQHHNNHCHDTWWLYNTNITIACLMLYIYICTCRAVIPG